MSINFAGLELTSDATETTLAVVYTRTGMIANAAGYDQVDLDLDLTAADTRVEIGLLLPAVQKVRAAAARMNVRSVGAGNTIVVDAGHDRGRHPRVSELRGGI